MNDLEILASLKRVFEIANDLNTNSHALSSDDGYFITDTIDRAYSKLYTSLLKKDKEHLSVVVDNKKYYIANSVYGDYQDEYDDNFTCADIGYEWFYDRDFIMKQEPHEKKKDRNIKTIERNL